VLALSLVAFVLQSFYNLSKLARLQQSGGADAFCFISLNTDV